MQEPGTSQLVAIFDIPIASRPKHFTFDYSGTLPSQFPTVRDSFLDSSNRRHGNNFQNNTTRKKMHRNKHKDLIEFPLFRKNIAPHPYWIPKFTEFIKRLLIKLNLKIFTIASSLLNLHLFNGSLAP